MTISSILGWLILLAFAAYILRAAVVWLADVIEGDLDNWDGGPKSSAPSDSVKQKGAGSANV